MCWYRDVNHAELPGFYFPFFKKMMYWFSLEYLSAFRLFVPALKDDKEKYCFLANEDRT
jgi:hypothetical protein